MGALALLTLLPGWVLNLGYRWEVTTRLCQGVTPTFVPFWWTGPVWSRGLTVWAVIALSLSPGAALALAGFVAMQVGRTGLSAGLWVTAGALVIAAFLLVPAGMTRLGCEGDRTVFTAPWRLWRAVRPCAGRYAQAWCVTGGAVMVSLIPALLGAVWWPSVFRWAQSVRTSGVQDVPVLSVLMICLTVPLFFLLSVWAWQVAGYAFTVALYGSGRARQHPNCGALQA